MTEMMPLNEKFEAGIKTMEIQVGQAIAAIRDEKSCDIAAALACECADWVDKIDKDFDESLKAAKLTVDKLTTQVKGYKAPYLSWKEKLNQAIGQWRWKAKKEIEDANRKAIEDARKESEEKAKREAARLEKKGEPELAAAVLAEPPPIVPILRELPKNKNVSDKTTWVVDIASSRAEQWKLIVQLVSGGPANMELISLDSSGLKKLAAIRHEEMKTWPGITVRPVFSSMTVRDRRANG